MSETSNKFGQKISNFIFEHEKYKKNLNILEFGVREGISTKMFLDLCKLNLGKLISVDIDDYSHLFRNNNWTFLKTRDDDINKIKTNINVPLDIILIDSFHDPNHVKKLIYMYWKYLKVGGSMYVDDISWLPYTEGNWRDHEYTEKINYDTFHEILNISATNFDKFQLDFSFIDSGMARLTKLNDKELLNSKNIKLRKNLIKNSFKSLMSFLKKT
tara:strand:- start:234 stop:878 length:645 start_codon:yes stop_codon:yes gene_type:complete